MKTNFFSNYTKIISESRILDLAEFPPNIKLVAMVGTNY